MSVEVVFIEKHKLGPASGSVERVMKPGDEATVTNAQATVLRRRKIVAPAKPEKPKPVDPKEREKFVRYRLERKDKAAVLAKLERLKVKIPKGADKAALIDLYVAEVDPKVKPKGGKKGDG